MAEGGLAARHEDDGTFVLANIKASDRPATNTAPVPGDATTTDAADQTFTRATIDVVPPSATQSPQTKQSRLKTTKVSAPARVAQGGFLSPAVRKLIARGVLAERDAVALALRARDQGLTFFHAMALDPAASRNAGLYAALAEIAGTRQITSPSELSENLADVDWQNAASAAARGALLLKSADDAQRVEYATIDPFDVLARDWFRDQCGKDALPVVVLPGTYFDVVASLRARTETPKSRDENLIPIDVSWQQESFVLDEPLKADIPLIVNYILQKCHGQGASDIHIEATDEGMLVRARIDGMLQEQTRMPLEIHSAVVSRIKIMAGMDVAERRRPQDGRITVLIRKSSIDVRVSTLPTVLGEKVVMRLLDDEALRPSPELLGMRDSNLRLVLDKISAPHGLILISGPTGSGKTTTLYSCLSAADRVRRNVVTIEDPVEYRLKGVHQMQVNEKIGLTFASGLRTLLRQDPDVIMVGECRDVETAHMAVQAALTGHVVFSTIHANDCISVVTRLLDMKIDSFLVASALSLSISQRLVRMSCKHCSVLMEGREILRLLRAEGISDEKMARLGIVIEDRLPCLHPVGCPQCRHTGYAGRQAVFEMLEISSDMRKLIVSDHFEVDTLRALARESGMQPMVVNGLQLVEEGRTTYSELIRVLGDK